MGFIKDEILVDEELPPERDPVVVLNNIAIGSTEFHLPKNLIITKSRIKIIGGESTDISSIRSHLSDEHFVAFVTTIVAIMENDVLSHKSLFSSMVPAFNRYCRMSKESDISISSLSILLEKCRNHQIASSDFRNVKALLKRWHQLNLPGVSDDIVDFISTVKHPSPKRPEGSKIRSDDPTEGWYTDSKYDSLVHAIWRAYESGREPLWRTTVLLLSAQFGRRPVQIANLKIGDLKSEGKSYGVSGRRIEFSGAKDKLAAEFRQSKIEVHPISDDLWQLCRLQATDTILKFEIHIGRNLSIKERLSLPLFTPIYTNVFSTRIKNAYFLNKDNNEALASPVLHISPGRISNTVFEGPRGETIISERTRQPLRQNAYRNRYTRTRQLAQQGVSRSSLEYWLGHETTFSLDVYYDDPAERARVLNDQIAPLLAPLAQAFQGTLRDSEAHAARGNDPSSRIEVDGKEELGVGTCGEHGFCSASVPIPCYRCTKFQPWVFGPHHEVLSRLLQRQRLENEVPRPGMKRRLLVPVQLDKDIQAVRSVIALCEARKAALKDLE